MCGVEFATPAMMNDMSIPEFSRKEWKTDESGVERGDAVGRGRKIELTDARGGVTRAEKSGTTILGFVERVPTMKKRKRGNNLPT
jgi:hypothetical protein